MLDQRQRDASQQSPAARDGLAESAHTAPMAEPDNIVLTYLRRIDDRLTRIESDMREIKERLGFLEQGYASLSRRVDLMDDRLKGIERRLDLADQPTG